MLASLDQRGDLESASDFFAQSGLLSMAKQGEIRVSAAMSAEHRTGKDVSPFRWNNEVAETRICNANESDV